MSGLLFPGCRNVFGLGNYSNGAGRGAGHGGRGGSGWYHGRLSECGTTYGRPDLPCELESGESVGRVAGGGMIVLACGRYEKAIDPDEEFLQDIKIKSTML
ncbi:hypothetical protein L2E82_32713 [Cichorium intybus]|uniref:Uncharacterized protein n=1 Tax=Cichorium intybus TaxID=13427 RepID=A0ACB9BI56_CICIN|nr:hypothetical protein L2E82_32713 [Cichorium intybus]